MSDYRLPGLSLDEVSVIQSSPNADSIWNLFWLSNPLLDLIPSSGPRWYRSYRPTAGLLSDCIWNVTQDECLKKRLTMHPLKFSDWFGRQDINEYRMSNEVCSNIMTRAVQAASRMLTQDPPVVIQDNVVHVKFGRAA